MIKKIIILGATLSIFGPCVAQFAPFGKQEAHEPFKPFAASRPTQKTEKPAGRGQTTSAIALFFERSDTEVWKNTQPELIQKVATPGLIEKEMLAKFLQGRSLKGIFATYKGWCSFSDFNGEILFPRLDPGEKITLVVTRMPQPVLIDQAIVHHFIASPTEPVAFYTLTRREVTAPDGITKKTVWDVEIIETPQNRVIPFDAIVIIADPREILMHLGTLPGIGGPNLILPTIMVASDIQAGIDALNFVKFNRYFSPVRTFMRYGTSEVNPRYGQVIES